jgi:GT2 family glycosyltransferase
MERFEAAEPSGGLNEPAAAAHPGLAGHGPVCSIVIPTYNGRALLARCLASIDRHHPDPALIPIEVVVVDNGSSDGTSEWLSRAYPGVRLVRIEKNREFCGAANAGLEAARGAFVQLLNDDTEVTAGWVQAGLRPFADPTVGSVAPLVVVRSDPSRVDSAGDSYAWFGWPMKRGHGQAAASWSNRADEEVFGASGSSAFYRALALRRSGTLDMFLVSYYEDIDLAFRLRWAGYRCVYNPTCVIHHDISATNDHRSAALQRRIARNAELVFWWNLPARSLFLAAVPHLAFVAAQAAWRLARGRLRPFLAGKIDAGRAWREILGRRRLRKELAHSAVSRPHFALSAGSVGDVRGHLRRPPETTRATTGPRYGG